MEHNSVLEAMYEGEHMTAEKGAGSSAIYIYRKYEKKGNVGHIKMYIERKGATGN